MSTAKNVTANGAQTMQNNTNSAIKVTTNVHKKRVQKKQNVHSETEKSDRTNSNLKKYLTIKESNLRVDHFESKTLT